MPQLWTEYLPNGAITFVKYNQECAEKYRTMVEEKGYGRLHIGDQANVNFLDNIIANQAGKQSDVIINDGGHNMHQQKTTVKHLWQLIKPNGIFVMEDLLTSYIPAYGGRPAQKGTMIQMQKDMQKDMLDGLHCDYQIKCTPVLPGLLDMDCFKEACVMVKESSM